MDVGTAFEMGYMSGLNKPVLGYYDSEPFYGTTEKPGLFIDRVAEFYQVSEENPGRDINGQSIENFQMSDNLMMMGSLQKGEGKISDSFEAAVLKIADLIIAQQ